MSNFGEPRQDFDPTGESQAGAVLTEDQAPPQEPVESESIPEPGAPAGEPVDAPSVESNDSTPGDDPDDTDPSATDTPAADAVPNEQTPDAPVAAEPAVTPERRPRGWLAADVRTLLDEFVTGKRSLEAGQHLTPHRVAKLVQEMDNLDKAPSSGAVAAVFKRWGDYDFATFNDKPFSFIDYTDRGRQVGLQGLIEERSANRKRTRAEAKAEQDRVAKEAKAAEQPAPQPAPEPAPEAPVTDGTPADGDGGAPAVTDDTNGEG